LPTVVVPGALSPDDAPDGDAPVMVSDRAETWGLGAVGATTDAGPAVLAALPVAGPFDRAVPVGIDADRMVPGDDGAGVLVLAAAEDAPDPPVR